MDKNNIIPLFTSDYSMRGILTIDKAEEIKENSPVSIFSIAKKYSINPVFIIENTFTGFIKAYKYAKETDTQLIFGLKIVVVSDLNEKTAESCRNESKIIIFINNSQGYYDLIKIFSLAATDGKYYVPRIDWASLKKLWTENLSLAIPFYDSFLHVNSLTMGNCVPDFPAEPVFFMESHDLPFDGLICDSILQYCIPNKNEIIQTHSCYCYLNKDITALQTYRAILNRNALSKPQLDHFASEKFSFESFLELKGDSILC